MNREEISALSFDCVLPSCIFFNENLEPNCIKLYAMVRNLTKMSGYCFAKNEFLANLLAVDERTIKRWLKSLSKEGYLQIETEKNGILWQRRIYLADKFKKCLRRDKNVLGGGDKIVPHKEEYYRKESPIVLKEDPPFSPKNKPKKEKLEVAQNVFLTSEQQQSLLQRLDKNPEKLKACYDKLSVWKIAKGQTNINDYLNIIRWVIKAVEDDIAKPKTQDKESVDKALAEKIAKKYAGHPDISVGHNYIEFNFGPMNRPHIKFGEGGFKEQVLNNLTKMKLKIDGL